MLAANQVRVPEPVAGEAIIVSRYTDGRRKAVIMHPSDYELFERLIEVFGEHVPSELELSGGALELHRVSESGEDVEELDLGLLDTA